MDERKTTRHDLHRCDRVLCAAERHARRPGFQPRQLRFVVRKPFGENANRTIALQHAKHRCKCSVVVELAACTVIIFARHWHRTDPR